MKLAHLLAGVGVVFLAAFLFPAPYGNSKAAARGSACLSNLKWQGLALNVYASDYDERYPLRDVWMDATRLYTPVPTPRCFALPLGSYGYAFNARLSGAQKPAHTETVPLIYDSVDPIRNASDRVTSLPAKGRHAGKNSIAYADGHARRVAP